MKWKRTAMSLALAGCMMATTVPVTAFAANETSVATEYAANKEIAFAQSSGTIVEGTATTLNVLATVQEMVDGTKITWESSDPTVATFSKDKQNDTTPVTGTYQDIIAVKPGTTKITATYEDTTISYDLTVVARKVFTGFSLDTTNVALTTADVGGATVETTNSTKVVTATADTNDVVTYDTYVQQGSEDAQRSDVVEASVDQETGKITLTAKKPGKALVKVTATATYTNALDNNKSETKSDVKWIEVVVTQLSGTDVLTSFKLYGPDHVAATETIQLVPVFNEGPNGVATVFEGDITKEKVTYTGDKTVKWTSNNPQIATVDDKGVVTGVKEGKTDIYAYAANGMIAHMTVDVTKHIIAVTNVEFKVKNMSIPVGGTNTESIVFTPEDATEVNGDVRYSIVDGSNKNAEGKDIIALNKTTGEVFGLNTGTVQVQAAYTTGGKTFTAFGTVTVTKEGSLSQVTEISIAGGDRITGSKEGAIVLDGSIKLPEYSVKPAVCKDYTTDDVKWSIGDESIAKIVGGRIVGLKNGTTTLTATVNGAASTIVIEVTGTSKLTGVELDIHKVTVVLPGETTKDKALIVDLGAGVKTSSAQVEGGLIWTSSDPSIVTVDGNGVVRYAEGVKAGTATITVTAGRYSDTCEVTVIDPDIVKPNPTIKFVDVADKAWYHDDVYAAAEKGLMTGIGDNKFAPAQNLQRSQVAQIVWNMAGNPTPKAEATPFTDVASTAWYAQPVAWAYQNEIIDGMTKTTFEPTASIRREDFVLMLYRQAGTPSVADVDMSKYADASSVDSWATDAVKWAVKNDILRGDEKGNLNPKANITRAEAAAVLVRYTK